MSPYQHLFSTNAVLNVWRNLRQNRGDPNDLLLTLQYQPDEARTKRFGASKSTGHEVERTDALDGGNGGGAGGKSIGFVVPWRSMQAQKRELREKEKELAEALVVLAGEVAFTGMYTVPIYPFLDEISVGDRGRNYWAGRRRAYADTV
jgi:hypothetical protein